MRRVAGVFAQAVVAASRARGTSGVPAVAAIIGRGVGRSDGAVVSVYEDEVQARPRQDLYGLDGGDGRHGAEPTTSSRPHGA